MSFAPTFVCISCGAVEDVATYVFSDDDGRLTERPLCPACVPPEPMSFADWLDWSYERQREAQR